MEVKEGSILREKDTGRIFYKHTIKAVFFIPSSHLKSQIADIDRRIAKVISQTIICKIVQ